MIYENQEGMEMVKDAHYPQNRHFLSLFDDMACMVGEKEIILSAVCEKVFPQTPNNKGELFPLTLVDTERLQLYMGV